MTKGMLSCRRGGQKQETEHEQTKRRVSICAVLLLPGLFAGTGRQTRTDAVLPLSQRIPNSERVVTAIRKGLREHAKEITVFFPIRKTGWTNPPAAWTMPTWWRRQRS